MKRRLLALAVVVLTPAIAVAGHHALPAPAPTVPVTVGTLTQQVWPYTYQAPNPVGTASDPVNLVFGNTDPREVRQALLALSGDRTPKFPSVAPFNCVWVDAMGYDQGAWAEAEGWVGGVVQMGCISDPKAPMGNPFRYHLRLFREGNLTLGAAHFEFQIPGTAEHEVLGWNPAQDLVVFDMVRTGSLIAPPGGAPMGFPGTFRAVQRPVYDGLVAGGATSILAYAGLYPAPGPGAVPMPLKPFAYVLTASIPYKPERARTTTPYSVTYSVVAPKPFCRTPADYVKLEGPLRFVLKAHTDPWGTFSRTYELSGVLKVTPLLATATGLVPNGPTVSAKIGEFHAGVMTDHWDQIFEQAGKTLLGEPRQSQKWELSFGEYDKVVIEECCDGACADRPRCHDGH